MKNQPFLWLVLSLVLGILAQNYIPQNSFLWLIYSALCAGLALIFLKKLILNAIFICLTFIGVGAIVFQLNHSSFSNVRLPEKQNKFEKKPYVLIPTQQFKSNEKSTKYKVKILQQGDEIISVPTNGLLYLNRSNKHKFHLADTLLLNASMADLPQPLNPHQFDYGKYLRRKKIAYQLFADEIQMAIPNASSWLHHKDKIKKKIAQKMEESGAKPEAILILQAMVLGERTEMDPELYNIFADLGIVHLFAVSGLHTGVVFSILLFTCYPLRFVHQKLPLFVSLALIWVFAWFVDFGPPVVRACIMLNVYFISVLLQRIPSIFHSMYVAAFLILLFRPTDIFDVGFQLSFSAVFAIAWWQDYFAKFSPKTYLKRYFYGISTMSIAAQLGVLPLSLFYFHRFSAWFFMANLIFIPTAFVVIALGLTLIFFVLIGIPIHLLVEIINRIVQGMLWLIQFFLSSDFGIYRDWHVNVVGVILLFLIGCLLKLILQYKRFSYIILTLLFIWLFQLNHNILKNVNNKESTLWVLHDYPHPTLAMRNGNLLTVFVHSEQELEDLETYVLKPFMIHEEIDHLKINHIQTGEVISWNDYQFHREKKHLSVIHKDTLMHKVGYFWDTDSLQWDLYEQGAYKIDW